MALVLESKVGGDFRPHVEGIHPAVCIDVIDLGLVETEWQGQRRLVNKVRLVFETEQRNEEGRNCIITKTFTASLHPKSKLADFLGKWRGRPVVPGESIDLDRLICANCTLVISHQQNMVGRTYASIDAVSKPTKWVAPSGDYDAALARQRIAEWKAKQSREVRAGLAEVESRNQEAAAASAARRLNPVAAALPQNGAALAADSKRQVEPAPHQAPGASRTGDQAIDPEVGF